MNKNELPDLISDLKDIKLNKPKDSSKRFEKEILTHFSTKELLSRCFDSNPLSVFTIELRCEKLINIPQLKEFKHLKVLDISSNRIKALTNLEYLKELKELKVFDNQLTNLLNLNHLKELVVLQAQYNQIQNLGTNVLSSCRKLKQIRLDNNCLSQITMKDFTSCSNLTYVDVSSNDLHSISFISCLPNLEEFYASYNAIDVIPDLSRCKKLSEIRLTNNLINNISGIKDHKCLAILDLSNNQITSLFNLGSLNQIEYLNLANNNIPINQLKFLETTFSKVEILNFSKNNLDDLDAFLDCVSVLCNLCELTILENKFPIIDQTTNEPYNSNIILNRIPHLKMLDNIGVKKPGQPNVSINHKTPPSLRPMTAASGISLRQVENQLNSFVSTLEEIMSQNRTCYSNTVQSIFNDDEVDKSNVSNYKLLGCSSTPKISKKSRLFDALVYASVNYNDDTCSNTVSIFDENKI